MIGRTVEEVIELVAEGVDLKLVESEMLVAALAAAEARAEKAAESAVRWSMKYDGEKLAVIHEQEQVAAALAQVEALKVAGRDLRSGWESANDPHSPGCASTQTWAHDGDCDCGCRDRIAAWRKAVDASGGGGAQVNETRANCNPIVTEKIAGVPIKDTLAPLPEEYRR